MNFSVVEMVNQLRFLSVSRSYCTTTRLMLNFAEKEITRLRLLREGGSTSNSLVIL